MSLSVNQLAAQIKLTEVWKSVNVEGNPTTLEPYRVQNRSESAPVLRPKNNRIFKDTARLEASKSSFHIDAAKLWNRAPSSIQTAPSLSSAKKAVLLYVKSLPI